MAALLMAAGAMRIGLGLRAAAILDGASDRILARGSVRRFWPGRIGCSPRAARSASASVAAMLTDKLPLLGPYVLRHRPASLRAAVVPLVFLGTAALFFLGRLRLILAVAGPLIPVFMALVGLAARQASETSDGRDRITLGPAGRAFLRRLTDIRLLDARGRMEGDFRRPGRGVARAHPLAVLRVAFLSSTVLELFSALGVAMVAVYVGFALLGELGFGAWATPPDPGRGGVFLTDAGARVLPAAARSGRRLARQGRGAGRRARPGGVRNGGRAGENAGHGRAGRGPVRRARDPPCGSAQGCLAVPRT